MYRRKQKKRNIKPIVYRNIRKRSQRQLQFPPQLRIYRSPRPLNPNGRLRRGFRMFWQRRKRGPQTRQERKRASPSLLSFSPSSSSYQLVIFSQIHQKPSTTREIKERLSRPLLAPCYRTLSIYFFFTLHFFILLFLLLSCCFLMDYTRWASYIYIYI